MHPRGAGGADEGETSSAEELSDSDSGATLFLKKIPPVACLSKSPLSGNIFRVSLSSAVLIHVPAEVDLFFCIYGGYLFLFLFSCLVTEEHLDQQRIVYDHLSFVP